ncbi:hypothetical protein [Fictibacillus arsenicus]|uniref:Uncharacterized protein n=1 Tax=Fictibacillus arsenicus TaxID=255247 RepID=A0A1V3G9A9_9BACL|nr:hypothetical protein [Fictibacillus arsenicus]OOE12566.1 hypothetical protein UN64_10850 [Fictibacillus arsenicus]
MSRAYYLNSFPVIFLEHKQGINNKISKIKSKNVNPNFIDRYYDMLANDYCVIGIGEICLNNDILAAKKNFYLAGKIQEILFQKYDNKEMKISSSFVSVSMNKYNRLLLAILSDSEELTFSVSHLLGGRTKEETEHGHPFINNVGYTIKYIALNEDKKAMEYIENFKKIKYQKKVKPYENYIQVLNGIVERDESVVNEGLNLLIEEHKKNHTINELISITALGLGKLAESKGIKVNINDQIAPYSVLKRDNINFPNLDFI